MREFSELRGLITKGFPDVVIDLTGPWFDRGREDEEIWICGFKDRRFAHEPITPGASGDTPEAALEQGLVFLTAWGKVLEEDGKHSDARKAGEDAMDAWEEQRRLDAMSAGPKA